MAKARFTPQMTMEQFEALLPTDHAFKGCFEIRRWLEGGRRLRHADNRTPDTGSIGKAIAAGAIERKGSVVARVIGSTDIGISSATTTRTIFGGALARC